MAWGPGGMDPVSTANPETSQLEEGGIYILKAGK